MPVKSIVRIEIDCDHEPGLCLRQPTIFTGATHQEAMNKARANGWYLQGERFALCPKHSAERDETLRVRRAPWVATVPQLSLTPENDKGPQVRASEVLASVEVIETPTRATGRD